MQNQMFELRYIAILVENGEFKGSRKAQALRRFDRRMKLFSTKIVYRRGEFVILWPNEGDNYYSSLLTV